MERELEARGFFLEFSESLKDKVSFHYMYREKYGESAITLGNRV